MSEAADRAVASGEGDRAVVDGAEVPHGRPRVWPAVVLLAAIWGWALVIRFANLSMFAKFSGMMLTTVVALLVFPIWWSIDRTRRPERGVALAAFFGFGVLATLLASRSFQAMGYLMLALPWVFTAWGAWAILARGASLPVRRRGLAAVLAVAWGAFLLVRTDGLTGEGNWQLHWRWTPRAEDRYFAKWSAPSTPATTQSAALLAATAGDWPEFRGPARDGVVRGVRIGTDWASAPPKLSWRERVGPGWSSVVVVGGRVFSHEQRGAAEAVVCRDAASGREVWVHAEAVRFEETLSGVGPRATPTFAGGRLYAMGATGLLTCLDAATGAKRWSRDLVADTGAKVPTWGFSSSPLVTDGRVIAFAGGPGENGLVAYDAETGAPAWKVEAGRNSYSSPQVSEVMGERLVLFWGEKKLVMVAPQSGSVQGTIPFGNAWGTLQPRVVNGGTQILLASDMATSLIRVRLENGNGGLWQSSQFRPQFNDFVVHDGFVYGLSGGNACCIDLATGKQRWRKGRYGYGQLVLLADQGLLVVACESGEVALLRATPDRHEELGRFEAVSGKTWGHPTVAHGRLYVRSAEEMACFELPPAASPTTAAASGG